MIEIAAHKTGELAAVLDDGLSTRDTVRIVEDGVTLAVVLPADDFDALVATQLLLSRTGALAAVAEGLADLAAGRTDDWLSLRTEFGRLDDDQQSRRSTVVSHRARWDLELLPPAIAEECFDALDGFIASGRNRVSTIGLPMAAPFDELRIAMTSGSRMVLRATVEGIAIAHIEAAT